MHYLRIGTLFVGLFLYQDIVQTNFFITHFSNELLIGENISEDSTIKTSANSFIIEYENESSLYIFNQREKLTESIQNTLVEISEPPKIQSIKSKRTRVGKRMALLSGTMLYGKKLEM